MTLEVFRRETFRSGLKCGSCQEGTLRRVAGSRPRDAGSVYRRHECEHCGYRVWIPQVREEKRGCDD